MTQQKITEVEVPPEHIVDRIVVIWTTNEDEQDTLDCIEYAKDELGYDIGTKSWENAAAYVEKVMLDKQTGDATTSTSDEEQLIDIVKKQDVEDVVVPALDALISPVRDVASVVRAVTAEGAAFHTVSGVTITAGSQTHHVLEASAMIEAEDSAPEIVPTEQGQWTGRPPLGHVVEDGRLKRSYDYDRVCAILQSVIAGDTTRTDAAHRLDTSRATINRCLQDRRDMYRLD